MEGLVRTALSFSVLISAAVTIGGERLKPRRPIVVTIFKPFTTILILAVAMIPAFVRAEAYAQAIALGLVFSLAGDVLLMLPDRFLAGLVAFLAGHLCYAFAFRSGARAEGFGWVLLGLSAVSAPILAYLWKGLSGKMRAPVVLYVATIVGMAALAIGRGMVEQSPQALAAAAGAVLFMASDTMLAINRFRRPFVWAEAGVLATYFAAQLLIVWST